MRKIGPNDSIRLEYDLVSGSFFFDRCWCCWSSLSHLSWWNVIKPHVKSLIYILQSSMQFADELHIWMRFSCVFLMRLISKEMHNWDKKKGETKQRKKNTATKWDLKDSVVFFFFSYFLHLKLIKRVKCFCLWWIFFAMLMVMQFSLIIY